MFVVIPLKNGEKVPKYSCWQNTTKTDYNSLYGATNTGILCGKVGKITVLDVDVKNGKQEIAESFMKKWDLFNVCNYIVKTTSGGYHFYFNYTNVLTKSSPSIDDVKFLDIMTQTSNNTSSFVVGAGSIVNDKMYTLIKNEKINDIPENLINYLKQITTKKYNIKKKPIDDVILQTMKILINDEEKEKIKVCLTNEPIKQMADDYYQWSLITAILKNYNLFEEWKIFSQQSNKFNLIKDIKKWNEDNNVTLEIHYLSYLYNTVHANKIHFSCKLYKKLTEIPEDTLMINNKYITEVKGLNDLISSEKCVIIKSHMNSGKTTLIREFIDKNDYNLISICPRISLVDDQFNNSKKITNKTFNHYKKTKKGQNIFTTIDSLHKIEFDDYKNIFLYLDEISSLLYYIQSVQYSNSNVMLNALIKICKMATKIICTDADINDCVLNFFSMIDINYKFVYNQYECPIVGKNYICSEDGILRSIKKDVENGKYVFVTSDRKNTTNMIYMFLRSLGVEQNKILLINRDETEKNKELYNTQLWHNKHIIISPSITIGVDFVPEEARNVYSIIEGGTINPILICQQIFRCRKIINIYTHIKPERKEPMIYSMKYVSSMFDNIRPVEMYENAHNEDIFNYILSYNIYADDLLSSAYRPHIYMYLFEKGYNSQELVEESDIEDVSSFSEESSNELAKNENIEEANIIINKYINNEIQNIQNTQNPIIKRLQILNIPRAQVEKFKETIIDENKFKSHLINSLYIDMIENPEKIKSKFILKNDYKNKIFKSSLGKVELLRRIYYGEDVEANKKAIAGIQRIKIIEKNDKQFIYRIFKTLGCNMFTNDTKYVGKKAVYSINEESYNTNKILKQYRINNVEFIDTEELDNKN